MATQDRNDKPAGDDPMRLAELLRRQNPHDTDEVIKLMNAASDAIITLAAHYRAEGMREAAGIARELVRLREPGEIEETILRAISAATPAAIKETK